MPRDITITFDDGTSHVYKNAPDNITPEQVTSRAQSDFSGKSITHLDGGNKSPQVPNSAASVKTKTPELNKDLEANINGAVAEPVMNMVSGMVAKPISDIAGTAATIYDLAKGEKDSRAQDFQRYVQNQLTYQPRTVAGKAVSENNPLAWMGQGIGAASHGIGNIIRGDSASDTARGVVGNAIEEGIPQAIGLGGAKIGPPAIKGTSEALRGGSESLMQSALKPTPELLMNGDAAVAIDTMLDQNIPLSKAGVEKIRAKIGDLNDQISDAVKNSTGTVKISDIAPLIQEKLNQFSKQVNPNADIASIKSAWDEFKNHPLLAGSNDIPVPLAQELKQGTYKQLFKKYGEMGSADVEAQKTIARGLKEGVASNAPEVAQFNKEESRLIRTLPLVERRVLMDSNKNPMGLSLIAKNPATWGAFMLDRSATFKAAIARILNASQEPASKAVAAVPAVAVPGAYLRPPQPPSQQQ